MYSPIERTTNSVPENCVPFGQINLHNGQQARQDHGKERDYMESGNAAGGYVANSVDEVDNHGQARKNSWVHALPGCRFPRMKFLGTPD